MNIGQQRRKTQNLKKSQKRKKDLELWDLNQRGKHTLSHNFKKARKCVKKKYLKKQYQKTAKLLLDIKVHMYQKV